MREITQIILDGVRLPMSSRDRYACWEDVLSVSLEMIAGNVVREIRGKVWRASYTFDTMDNDLLRQVLEVLRRGDSFPAAVLPDNGDALIASQFHCESLTPPTFAFSDGGEPIWHNLAFTLREVDPHD